MLVLVFLFVISCFFEWTEDFLRKDVRVVEGVDLERLYGYKIIEGSNPSLSVFFIVFKKSFFSFLLFDG